MQSLDKPIKRYFRSGQARKIVNPYPVLSGLNDNGWRLSNGVSRTVQTLDQRQLDQDDPGSHNANRLKGHFCMHPETYEGLGYADVLECIASVYRALDASDGTALIRAFAPDAVWHRQDGDLSGQDQIEAMANNRDPSRITAHVVGNLALEKTADGWIAKYYVTAYAGRGGHGEFVAILACEDSIIATKDGPRVTMKRSKPLLRAGIG